MGCVAWPPAGYCANAPNANKNVQEMTAVLMVFTVKVSLARGAASPFEMRVIPQRRADQLTMHKKIMGREAAASAALKSGTGSSSAFSR
jgi:hypothetical protein